MDVRRGALHWRMAVSEAGTTPFDNLWPALIEWPTGVHPAASLTPTGIRLRRLTLTHPEGSVLQDLLARHLTDHRMADHRMTDHRMTDQRVADQRVADHRVAVEVGPVGMHADFSTPHGDRSL